MVLLQDFREAVYSRFQTGWAATPFSRVVFDNDDAVALALGNDPWVRVSAREVGGGQITLGPPGERKYDRRAVVVVQVFTPTNTGLRLAGELASAARALLEGVAFSGVDSFDARVREVGPTGRWHLTVVEADITYEEIK